MTAAQQRLLTSPCLACNRETGWPMCQLCQDLEDAEDRANERSTDDDD